jgi:hypothetical protein
MINEVRGENNRLLTMIKTQLDLVLQRLPKPLAEMNDRLVALEHTVGALQDVQLVLDDLRHRQLTKIQGDIGKVQEGIEELKPEFCQGLDNVNLRVDDILTRMGTPPARDTPSQDMSPPVAGRADGTHLPGDTPSTAWLNKSPPLATPVPQSEDVSGTADNPARGRMGFHPPKGQRWASGGTSEECPPRFRDDSA